MGEYIVHNYLKVKEEAISLNAATIVLKYMCCFPNFIYSKSFSRSHIAYFLHLTFWIT